MKKKHMVIIGILAVLLSFAVVHAVFQIKQLKEIKEESGKLHKEIGNLRDQIETLQEEKQEAEDKLEKIKEEQKEERKAEKETEKEEQKKIAIDPGLSLIHI